MVLISWTIAPIFSALSAKTPTILLVRSASCTAVAAVAEDCATWREISVTELDSSSVAAATVCTFALASSAAAATAVVCWPVLSAMPDIDCAFDCNWLAAAAT